MTNPRQPDPLKAHFRAVDMVAAVAAPPKDWVALRRRWEAFTELGTPMHDQLVAAVVDGGAGDVPMLAALATGEASELGQRASVANTVRKAVLARLVEIYSKAAAANYRAVGKEFDTVAANFTDVAGNCDPETDAAAMVDQSDQTRQAWINAEIFARRLDGLVPVVRAAATLAGLPERASRELGGPDAILLPLVCDPGELHRRRIWEAFAAKGRCGRWSALLALGATIRAANLEGFALYRSPTPLERRVVPGSFTTHGHTEFEYDPEDEPTQEPEPVTPRRARALTR